MPFLHPSLSLSSLLFSLSLSRLIYPTPQVAEFDTPLNLLNKVAGSKGAIFRSMVDATGTESARLLREIAEGKTDMMDIEDIIAEAGDGSSSSTTTTVPTERKTSDE